MTFEEVVKAMKAKRPVYYMGDYYDIVYCKESTNGDVVLIKQRSLSNRYDPVEIEPLYLTTEEVGHV